MRWQQLLDTGLARSTLWRQVLRGDWKAYGRDVLIARWAPDDFETRANAAMLSQPELPATGLAAVLQYPASPLRPLLPVGDVPWLVAPRALAGEWLPVAHPGAKPVTRNERLVLLEEDVLIDLLRLLPKRQALDTVWLGLQDGATTKERLLGKAEPLLGLAGRRQLREITALIRNGAKSSGEERMITIVEAAGLRGVPGYPVSVGDKQSYLDYAFPEAKLALEFDGYRFHSGPAAARRNSQRHNLLSSIGWDIRYFTWSDVTEACEQLVAHVRLALGRGRAIAS